MDCLLMCRWDGVIIENNNLVRYQGENLRPIVAAIDMSLCEFVELLYKVCGFDKHMVEVRLKMKYPTSQSTFNVVALDEEYSMNALWALVRNLGCSSTEIYTEQVPINCNEMFLLQLNSCNHSLE